MTTTTTSYPTVHLQFPEISCVRQNLIKVSDNLWRVCSADARIIGHLRVIEHPLGTRYRAERLNLHSGTFRNIGEFWNADDAVESLAC